jgi:hypothetical protein
MPVPSPVVIATGFADALGCDYQPSQNRLIVADAGNGKLSAVNATTHVSTLLGSGYHSLADVVVSKDDVHAYVNDRQAGGAGILMRVDLANADRVHAHVIANVPNQPGQIALDEAHGFAYMPEFGAGRLIRVNLNTGVQTPVASGLNNVRGLLMTSDGRFAYVSEDTGRVRRFDLVAHTDVVIASGIGGPRHLAFADAGETVILVPAPNPNPGIVLKIDVTATPATVTQIAVNTPDNPYEVAVLSPEKLLISSAQKISQVDLTSSVYSPAGPVFLGIGFVPFDRITTGPFPGYADTTVDPTYFFQVKDAPFGGTLPLMINHDKARALGAAFYKVMAGPAALPVESHQAYTDYLWNTALNRFELATVVPVSGFYPVHQVGQLWYNHWLGMRLDTSAMTSALNVVSIRLFNAAHVEIGSAADPGRTVQVMIDNTYPTALIGAIKHDGSDVPVCSIVNSGSSRFQFEVTAEAAKHLRAWSLSALWGDNRSKAVAGDDYSHHVVPNRIWTGIHAVLEPAAPWDAAVAGDSTSTRCAHTFYLSVADRVIDGYAYIHGSVDYHKSITIWL